ncbi:MAG: carboxylating nicotinate-nucleotide diphosphorylase [Candidatus Omnitrophica bacterium]|nr:carboxylating nicotinate-nucleotide diphosphorylase [Candidatus Omnitrophota bacterium]MDE2223569.1 carboxylating nicotinate-nucleotide diphosphorylase [Candidatus Omnitrophota bacterium]
MKAEYVRTIVQLALTEDIGDGDITTDNLIPQPSRSKARLIAQAPGIICGLSVAREVFKTLNPRIVFRTLVEDGQKVRPGQVIAIISGPTRILLTGERVALNFLTHLSGIATTTRTYVQAVKPYKTAIMDTRKTTPLLRQLERYAVRQGGGVNHRFNLNDMVMIKDNHRVFCLPGIPEAVGRLKLKTRAAIEVEVDNFDQLKEALRSTADIILLDNMTPAKAAQAVKIARRAKSRALLEASGGITPENIKRYAATGVDRISIGALTHSPRILDISMELE